MTDTYQTFRVGLSADGDDSTGSVGGAQFYISALKTLQTTMVGVGTGDNSANVTTMGTDLTALASRFNAFAGNSGLTPSAAVTVNVNTTMVPTVSVLAMYLRQILTNAISSGMAP